MTLAVEENRRWNSIIQGAGIMGNHGWLERCKKSGRIYVWRQYSSQHFTIKPVWVMARIEIAHSIPVRGKLET